VEGTLGHPSALEFSPCCNAILDFSDRYTLKVRHRGATGGTFRYHAHSEWQAGDQFDISVRGEINGEYLSVEIPYANRNGLSDHIFWFVDLVNANGVTTPPQMVFIVRRPNTPIEPSPIVQELSVSGPQQNACSEEDIAYFIPRSTTDLLADRQRERKAEKFSLVQDNRSIREYTRQEVDKLTPTQREKLFTADPEMSVWWRGKSLTSGAWPLFRIRGGQWIAKHQIEQTPREHHSAIWEIPGLLEWYLQGREF
jgi:hypothetical protein